MLISPAPDDTMAALGGFMWLILALALWDGVWKALAMYRAGVNRSPGWFIALLLLNTVGVLPILYLFVFGKKKN